MRLGDLVRALLAFDTLTARQWVTDARRLGFDWSVVPRPDDLDGDELRVAAGVAELLAARSEQRAPTWTADVPESCSEVCLVKAALTMPRLRALCVLEGPEPLRRRGILAPPEFLDVA